MKRYNLFPEHLFFQKIKNNKELQHLLRTLYIPYWNFEQYMNRYQKLRLQFFVHFFDENRTNHNVKSCKWHWILITEIRISFTC